MEIVLVVKILCKKNLIINHSFLTLIRVNTLGKILLSYSNIECVFLIINKTLNELAKRLYTVA